MRAQREWISEVDSVGAEVDSLEKILSEPWQSAWSHFLGLVCIRGQEAVH